MHPSIKTPEIDRYLTDMFGVDRRESIEANRCVNPPIGCGKPITPFRDQVSENEYLISGLCQSCQDDIFGP